MDLFRMYLPQVVGFVVALVLIYLVSWLVSRVAREDEEGEAAIPIIARWRNVAVLIAVVFYLLSLFVSFSVNVTPRKTIDQSAVTQQQSQYEQRVTSTATTTNK